ncbi:MAG: OmpA family protein [Gammaproteobacteria bacterium]|nr:OmpA family protein [Gammaproteobacteria bacterium]MCB1904864.1 OmpA family protein [Gammaproteobacteria bacterium]
MSGHLKVAGTILGVGLLGILAAKYLLPIFQESQQRSTSDAVSTKGSLNIGMDNWVGYFPLCSQQMQARMRHAGYVLGCENDNADYQERFKRLKAGKLQFAVATVDSYLLNAKPLDFPGTIVAVIDESKGGDAIVARKNAVASLDELRGKGGLKVAFTPDSPSAHLLKAIGSHFDIARLKSSSGPWQLPTNGSEEALQQLLSGKADVAVLWEPDVTRALSHAGIVKLMGTEDTDRLIVDILVVNRAFSQDHPEAVRELLDNYFQVLKEYKERPEELREEVVEVMDLDAAQVHPMLKGVAWAGLNENGAIWFGISPHGAITDEGIVETIDSVIKILQESGDFKENPLPDGDPYRITNRQFISELYAARSSTTVSGPTRAGTGSLDRAFAPLDAKGWARLKEVGTLKVDPIGFQSGTSQLAFEGKLVLDRAAERIKHYPNFRLLVKGHTGLRGDDAANRRLSQERADSVTRYLMVTYGLDANRIQSLGYGSSRPLPRQPDESERAYGYRLPRVELSFAAEDF